MFYFIYINLQESLAFLVAAFFSNVQAATGLLSVIEVVNIATIAHMKKNVYENDDEPIFLINFQQLI